VAGTLSYSGRRSIDWRMAAWLGAGVVPTAIAGAWAKTALPEGLLMALLAALMVLTGTDTLLRSPDNAGGHAASGPPPFSPSARSSASAQRSQAPAGLSCSSQSCCCSERRCLLPWAPPKPSRCRS
jgi:uncharacterized membrane protein YfcA